MTKKKSCQNVRVPRVLSAAESDLYGWVDEEVFSQPSVVVADTLPELRHEMRLTARPIERLRGILCWRQLALPIGCPSRLWRIGLTSCANQLHLNGWDFLRMFEHVCLHFGFRPSWCVFFYIYQLHALPLGKGFMSFRAHQGQKLFYTFEESVQEFKWHYFKVLPLPGSWPFWLDDEGTPFPRVYWNSEVGDYRIDTLDPLETLAFEFLQSLPTGLLGDMEKQSRFDRLRAKMAESILPVPPAPAAAAGASTSIPAAPAPQGPSFSVAKAKKKPSVASSNKPFSVEREEVAKEDPSADLRQKRRKRKAQKSSPEEAALGANSAWEHKGALDSGLTQGPLREVLGPVVPEQLLGTAQQLACKLTACLQVGIENTFSAKLKMEKELAATKDRVNVLTAKRDSAKGERLSALARMKEVEEGSKVQAVELQSCHSALDQEMEKVESLIRSLEQKQTALDEAEAAADHWRQEWKALAEETGKMVQETFDILMDQVHHPNPAVDYSMITLDTRWDPKGKRIYKPKAATEE
ncbi:hypothetical protein PIB30_064388 [Stylosanthes scabra]|uniref:Transposase (Putative), gypsy type n=1 Tax=Stylosanthes scabra TaxID=79078 RepID=A0ABU6RM23_9FABA|nr:hypothetical protein [Stylosanthes scabra]